MKGWHLKNVVIQSPMRLKTWDFPCNLWLDKSKGDKKIERELYPSEKEVKPIANSKVKILFLFCNCIIV